MDGTASQITCVSVSGHGNGLYALDEAGALPFGFSSMLTQQADRLPAQETLLPIVLQSRWPGQPLSILAWLKQTKPDLYYRMKKNSVLQRPAALFYDRQCLHRSDGRFGGRTFKCTDRAI